MMRMINITTQGKQPMGKMAAVCCECFLAYSDDPDTPNSGVHGTCECGGLLVKPEIPMAVDLHYAAVIGAANTICFNETTAGTMH